MTVTRTPLTVTASSPTVTFGDAIPTITAAFTGFVNSDSASSLTGPTDCTTTYTRTTDAGTAPGTSCSGLTSDNYEITYAAGSVIVDKAPQYLEFPVPTLSGQDWILAAVSYWTFDAAKTATSLDVTYTSATPEICVVHEGTAQAHVLQAGTCTITASQAGSTNFTAAVSVQQSFAVTAGPPVITTLHLHSGTYGTAYSTTITAGGGTGSYTGFILVGTLPAGLTFDTTTGLLSGTPTDATGPIELTFKVTDSGSVTSVDQVLYLTISPAPLSITAPDRSVSYGAAVPDLTPKLYSGFVNADTASSVFGSGAQCSTSYVAGTPVADSGIGITCTNLTASNDTITYTAGSVLISPAPLTATGPTHSVAYGTATPNLTPQLSGYVAGDDATKVFGSATPQCTTTYAAGTSVALSPVSVPCTNLSAANYTISPTPGSITITKTPLVIKVPTPAVVYGVEAPTLNPTYTGSCYTRTQPT